MLAFNCIVLLAFIAVVNGALSRESTVSSATVNSLNNLMLHAYHRATAMLHYTGDVSTVPMSNPYIHSTVSLTGDSQQAIYGVQKR